MKRKVILLLFTILLAILASGCATRIDTQPNVSQRMYEAVQEDWAAWNAMSKESQLLSSSKPGNCQQGFDDWHACEEFMELTVPNPLESCEWLEKGTYAAMPLGYADAPRVMLNWYGEEDGTIEKVRVTAGYRQDDIRVMLYTDIYGEATVVAAESDMNTSTTQNYFSVECNIVEDNILYRLSVIGEPDAQAQVEDIFTQVLKLFPE